MKKVNLYEADDFADLSFKRLLVHDSPDLKILNFNFKAGASIIPPVHCPRQSRDTVNCLVGPGRLRKVFR